MSPEVIEAFNVIFRFTHVVAAIMWIGDSLLFTWMEINLIKDPKNPNSLGSMNMLHGGGVFFLEKRVIDPKEMPEKLHRFLWQSYTTWLSGFTLLVMTFYTRSGTLLLDPGKTHMAAWQATAISALSLVAFWLLYDFCWRSALRKYPAAGVAVLIVTLALYANWIDGFFNGRFVYLQLGAMLATTMTANVFLVIIPNQRKMIARLEQGLPHDLELGRQAKLRSMTNHFVTFPVIFLMLSAHFPSLYGDRHNLLLIAIICVGLVVIKRMMNLYHDFRPWLAVAAGTFFLCFAAIIGVKYLPVTASAHGVPAPVVSPAALAGEKVFGAKGCIACHQPAATTIAPTLHGLYGQPVELATGEKVIADEAYLRESILQSPAKIVRGFAPAMPVYGGSGMISDEEVGQLVEYIKSIGPK